jgi:hypothetical protein
MTRAVHRALMLLALGAGALAAVAGSPAPPPARGDVAAVELAEWIRARRPGLQVLDTRSPDAMWRDRVPGARSAAELATGALDAEATLVVYADRNVDEDTLDALRRRSGTTRILHLHGGVEAWNAEVMFPWIRADASAREQREFAERALLSRYFGGSPRVLEPGAARPHGRSRRGC